VQQTRATTELKKIDRGIKLWERKKKVEQALIQIVDEVESK
jgi:hypothetical protein